MVNTNTKRTRPKASANLYVHPFSAAYWRDAAYQLFDTRMLCVAAIITALRIAVKAISIHWAKACTSPSVSLSTHWAR